MNSSELLLEKVLGFVFRLVIAVHVCSLNVRKTFKLVLKILSNVMRLSECLVWMKDNVNFHSDARTRIPRPDGIQAQNVWAMGHGHIGDQLEDMSRSGDTNE